MINVKSIKTPYGNFYVGQPILNQKYNELEKKYDEYMKKRGWTKRDDSFVAYNGYVIGGEPFLIKDGDVDIINEIIFYPEINKFEIISNEKIIQEIISQEYSVKRY